MDPKEFVCAITLASRMSTLATDPPARYAYLPSGENTTLGPPGVFAAAACGRSWSNHERAWVTTRASIDRWDRASMRATTGRSLSTYTEIGRASCRERV